MFKRPTRITSNLVEYSAYSRMKIFRKPCMSVSDVASSGHDKKFTLAKKKDLGFDESQYEYVRREYGYDYVPPSQYAPSRSPDSEDEYESVAVKKAYSAVAPVKILAPPSDLSGSVDDGDVLIPKHQVQNRANVQDVVTTRRHGSKHRMGYPKRPSETNPIHPRSTIMEGEEEGELIHRSSRRHQEHRQLLPIPRKQPVERHGHSNRKKECKKHEQREQYGKLSQIPDRRPGEEDCGAYRSDRHRRRSVEVKSDGRNRRSYPTSYINKRGQREDEDIDDYVAIEPVQTAFSYSSNDSAEVLIQEKSKGSRYNSTQKKDGTNRRDERYGVSNFEAREEEYDLGKGSGSTDIAETDIAEKLRQETMNGSYEDIDDNLSASQLYSENDKTETRRNTSSLDDFAKPRYDRKKRMSNEIKQAWDEKVYRSRPYQDETRDVHIRGSMKSQAWGASPPLQTRHEKIQRRDIEKHNENIIRERDDYDQNWDGQTEDRSFHTTPSGEVASDYEYFERKSQQPSLQYSRIPNDKKRGSRGFLGRIRDSVRGQKKSSTAPLVSPAENFHLYDDDEKSIGFSHLRRLPNKTSGLFEQIQPSVRSEVSVENRRVSNSYGGDLPSSSPSGEEIMTYTHHERDPRLPSDKRHGHHHDRPDIPRNSRRSSNQPVDEKTSHWIQRHRSDFSDYNDDDRRQYEEAYWESASAEYSGQSPEKNHPMPLSGTSSAVPFQSIRTETPVLRANPDLRQRHLPVSHTISRHYSKGCLSPYHQQSKLAPTNTSTQPVRGLKVPKKSSQTVRGKQNAPYRTNRKGFKIGFY